MTHQLQKNTNLDFGLITLVRILGLPQDPPIVLFAIGHTSGWIAHALEQYESDRLIRTPVRYIGRQQVETK